MGRSHDTGHGVARGAAVDPDGAEEAADEVEHHADERVGHRKGRGRRHGHHAEVHVETENRIALLRGGHEFTAALRASPIACCTSAAITSTRRRMAGTSCVRSTLGSSSARWSAMARVGRRHSLERRQPLHGCERLEPRRDRLARTVLQRECEPAHPLTFDLHRWHPDRRSAALLRTRRAPPSVCP